MPTALVGRYWYSYINEGIVDNITILYTIIFYKYGILQETNGFFRNEVS